MLAYAQKHFPGSVSGAGKGEARIVGHQGLLVNEARGFWYQHGTGRGGNALDLVGYVTYGERWNKRDRALFKTVLAEAAGFARVALTWSTKAKRIGTGEADCLKVADAEKAEFDRKAQNLLNLTIPLKIFNRPSESGSKGGAYVEVPLKNRPSQVWPVRSRLFYSWLQWCYYEQTGQLPAQQSLYVVVGLLEAKAFCEGQILVDNDNR